MTAFGFFASGISALRGHTEAFASISQDIANLTTDGYKATDTQFAEMVHTGDGSIFEQFSGLNSRTRNLIEHQGTILSTNRNFDIAIDGTGFLVTNTLQDLSGDTQLTRAGSLDRRVVGAAGSEQAFLADQNGNFVLGWPSDGAGGFSVGTTVSSLQPIRIDSGAVGSAAAATTTATMAANLSAESTTGANFDLNVGVFDNLGNTHTFAFRLYKERGTQHLGFGCFNRGRHGHQRNPCVNDIRCVRQHRRPDQSERRDHMDQSSGSGCKYHSGRFFSHDAIRRQFYAADHGGQWQ